MLALGAIALGPEANAAEGSVTKSPRGPKVMLKAPRAAAPGDVVRLKGSVKKGRKPLSNARVKIHVSTAATPMQPSVGSEEIGGRTSNRWITFGRSKTATKANGKFRTRVKLPEAVSGVRLRAVLVKPSPSKVISSRTIRIRISPEAPGAAPAAPLPRERPNTQAPDRVPPASVPDGIEPEPGSPEAPTEPTEPESKERTVLLVPGYGGVAVQLEALSRWLAQRDVESEVIYIGDGLGDLREYAEIVEARAAEIIASGAPAPDLIGYSAGGLTARTAFTNQPQSFRKIVTLASPHQGTWTAVFAGIAGNCPIGCQQMQPGSDLLGSFPEPQRPTDWLSVWSQDDEAILPASSSVLPLITNYRIQDYCADRQIRHGGVPGDPQVRALIEAFLAEEPIPMSCVT